jgi:hypothetical protein
MWEVVWMSSAVLPALLCLMPETSSSNILFRRARRLRQLTGDSRLQSQSEIDQRNLAASKILFSALVRPMEIMLKDPSIFFVNLYTGYFYAVFYSFFEVFPLVFPPFYGFNLGQTGLAFLSCFIGVSGAISAYFAYLRWYMVPDNLKNGLREQEHRLVPAIFGYCRLGCSCSHGLRIRIHIGRYPLLVWVFSASGTSSPCNRSSSIFRSHILSTLPLSSLVIVSGDQVLPVAPLSSQGHSSRIWASTEVSVFLGA